MPLDAYLNYEADELVIIGLKVTRKSESTKKYSSTYKAE